MEYKKITKKKLKEIIKSHKLWLEGNPEGIQADLSDIDLRNVDLRCVDLRYADLRHTNLYGANLCHADLTGAILYEADLSSTDLGGANLCCSSLRDADLSYAVLDSANLSGADLYRANLDYANLTYANLTNANLSSAYLSNANLSNARLTYADLTDASLEYSTLSNTNLSGAIGSLMEFRKGKILTEPMVGYKKCRNNVIVTLEIPEGAVVFSINGKKCRTNKAKVVSVDGADKGISVFDKSVSYHLGDEIVIRDFNCEYNIECSTGIHFFTDRKLMRSIR